MTESTETQTKTATLVSKLGLPWLSDARLYKLDPPDMGVDHLIASAVSEGADGGAEVLLFPSTAGADFYREIFLEVPGTDDHAAAIKQATGYEVVG